MARSNSTPEPDSTPTATDSPLLETPVSDGGYANDEKGLGSNPDGTPAGTDVGPTGEARNDEALAGGVDGDPQEVGYFGHSPGPTDDGLSQANPLVMNQNPADDGHDAAVPAE